MARENYYLLTLCGVPNSNGLRIKGCEDEPYGKGAAFELVFPLQPSKETNNLHYGRGDPHR